VSEEWVRVTADNAHQLKVGDRLLEQDLGMNIYSVVTSTPQQDGPRWMWSAAAMDGKTIDYMITAGTEHYGPYVYVARGEEDEPEQIDTDTNTPIKKPEEVLQ
jgi:hypothetical protein